jgi:DNA-binding GntR family transcriptional regulator
MSRAAPISRSVLSDQVKDRLLQAILAGEYPPGSRIVETRVAQELGTSQAPVREALRDLEALGLVQITAYRGARVRRPTRAELLEAYVIRTELETLAARLALARLPRPSFEALQGDVDEMQWAVREGDAHAEALADARFHGRIVELSGNQTLVRVWRHLEPFSRTYITIFIPGADRARIAELHLPILLALRQRDANAVAEALAEHFSEVGTMLGSLWADVAPEPDPSSGPPPGARSGSGARPGQRRGRRGQRPASTPA